MVSRNTRVVASIKRAIYKIQKCNTNDYIKEEEFAKVTYSHGNG